MNIKWQWYPPRNANRITIRMKDFTEYDIFAGLTGDRKHSCLMIYRYNPKGYKTTRVLYKIHDTIGLAMYAGHKIIENLISNGGIIT